MLRSRHCGALRRAKLLARYCRCCASCCFGGCLWGGRDGVPVANLLPQLLFGEGVLLLLLLLLLLRRGRLIRLAATATDTIAGTVLLLLLALLCLTGRQGCRRRCLCHAPGRGRLQAPPLKRVPEVLPMHYERQLAPLRLQGEVGRAGRAV